MIMSENMKCKEKNSTSFQRGSEDHPKINKSQADIRLFNGNTGCKKLMK